MHAHLHTEPASHFLSLCLTPPPRKSARIAARAITTTTTHTHKHTQTHLTQNHKHTNTEEKKKENNNRRVRWAMLSGNDSGRNGEERRLDAPASPHSDLHHIADEVAMADVAARADSQTLTVPLLQTATATLHADSANTSASTVEGSMLHDISSASNTIPPPPMAFAPLAGGITSPLRVPVPLITSPLSAVPAVGTAATAAATHQQQSNAVANTIVRSSSAFMAPEQPVVVVGTVAGGRDGVTPPAAVDASGSGSPLTAAAMASLHEHADAAVTRPTALEVLQRAVNHVWANTSLPGPAATEDERAGHRLALAVRSVMRAAEMIDQEDVDSSIGESDLDDARSETTTATRRSYKAADWRDDTDSVVSPSAFFHSEAALQVRSNRVMEYIVGKGHAAQTDEELTWLYRHALLTSLLDAEDLQRLVPRSLHREYTGGELILDLGAPVQHLYVVAWGNVDVFRVDSLNNERKAMEGAFRVASHQSVSMKMRSLNRFGDRRGSIASYGLNSSDAPESAAQAGVSSDATYTHVASLCPGQVFGIENCVFNATSHYVFRAGRATSKTVVSLLPYEELQPVLARNPRFSQGVGVCITGSMDVFGPIREFCRYVFSPTSAQNEYLPLWSILESYTRIHNVIHTKLFSHEVDTGAWGYALNRLPDNLTSTFCFDLVHALPPFVASRMKVAARAADTRKAADSSASGRGARTAIEYIRTKERRRCTWHLGMEGKTLVLLRDGFTDLLDFLTMLCVHIIESNKLRGRVQGMVHPPAIDVLDDYLRQREQEELAGKYLTADGITRDAELVRVQTILKRMPLTAEEQAGLLRNWGHNTLLRIYEIMMHREEYNVRVDPSMSIKFQTNPFHEWALNLRGCVLEKLGLDRFSALPDNLYIDVISSNTHCIKNLLCSFNRKYRKEILDYVRRKEGKRLGRPEEWHNVDDMMYAAVTGFLQSERPDLKEEYTRSLEENGITVLQDTAMTGLQVDVIPVHSLNFDTVDETIREALHEYYQALTKHDGGEGESGPSFHHAPTWAQVCKPIWRRSSDGSRMRVPGCMMPNGHGDISSNAAAHAPPKDSDDDNNNNIHHNADGKSSASAAQPTTRVSANSSNGSPAASPTGTHGRNGRLQRHFIINMDFAFGAQAEGICRVIFSAFGKRIRSVSVMGKAGGLAGKRGDIQLASHVLLSKSSLILEDNQDELRNCRNQDLTAQRLQELAGPRVRVHHGKVLTVTGTMLQNAHLLRYYQQVWRCVGTEMEGSYFARVIEDFYRQGIAHPGLTSRFAYYTSDLPLAQSDAEAEARRTHRAPAGGATLSAPMSPIEGVPPLYAIARGILENVLL
ncbi:Cyclic nucleotide-binding domain containing protein [Novymonas esmeraldas]|uniref:Cyclic nucleotide-binding domain containing protein n=1 Tax=Novymonas esmeraldas TaxID=1808958 RepID=A0AAW0ET33_9TRYP